MLRHGCATSRYGDVRFGIVWRGVAWIRAQYWALIFRLAFLTVDFIDKFQDSFLHRSHRGNDEIVNRVI